MFFFSNSLLTKFFTSGHQITSGGFLPPHSSILQCQQGVLRLSDSTGWGLHPKKAAPFQMLISSPDCCLWFWPTAYQSEVPSTLMGSIICYSGSELRKSQFTSYMPVDYKWIQLSNSQTEEMRRAGMGLWASMSSLGAPPSPCTSIYSSNPLNLWKIQLGFFMKAPSHRHNWLNHWPSVAELISSHSSLGRWVLVEGWKGQPSNHGQFYWLPAPPLGAFQK